MVTKEPSNTIKGISEEYEAAQVKGVITISMNQVENRLSEISDLPRLLTVYCRNGSCRATAVSIINQPALPKQPTVAVSMQISKLYLVVRYLGG